MILGCLHLVSEIVLFATVADLRSIFGLPTSTDTIFFWPEGDISSYRDPTEVFRVICCPGILRRVPIYRELTSRAKLINRIILHNIVPHGDHFDELHPFQFLIIYASMTHWRLEIAHILFCVLVNVCTSNGSFPYGMALTRLFHHFHVPLDDVERFVPRSQFDQSTMNFMHLTAMEEDELIALDAPAIDEVQTELDRDEEDIPLREATHAGGDTLMPDFHAHFDARMDTFGQRMDAYDHRLTEYQTGTSQRLDAMDSRLGHIKETQGRIAGNVTVLLEMFCSHTFGGAGASQATFPEPDPSLPPSSPQ